MGPAHVRFVWFPHSSSLFRLGLGWLKYSCPEVLQMWNRHSHTVWYHCNWLAGGNYASRNQHKYTQNSAEHATHFSIFHSDTVLYIVEDAAANYGNLPVLRFMHLNQLFKMQKEHLYTLCVWKFAQFIILFSIIWWITAATVSQKCTQTSLFQRNCIKKRKFCETFNNIPQCYTTPVKGDTGQYDIVLLC